MLKKLKRKFILINMILVGVVLLAGCIALDVYEYRSFTSDLSIALEKGASSFSAGGEAVPSEIGAGGKGGTNISVYVVSYNSVTGEITTLTDEQLYMDGDTLSYSVNYAVSSPEKEGKIEKYGLSYYKTDGMGGIKIAFADSSYVSESMTNMIVIEAAALVAFMAILYFISLFLAKTALKPIEETWTGQKRFIADASHELKTPLTVIMANCEIMRSHPEENVENQMGWIDSTEEEGRHMKALIEDMLTLSKNETASAAVKEDVDFSKTVNRVFLQYEAVAYERGVGLSCSTEDGVTVLGDGTKLKQLVMILSDNALKYEPKGGSAEITLKTKGGFACLTVKNKSSVISEKDLPHVFDRFYRSDSSRSSEGFGLGLAIAKSIAELHGGNISVSSSADSGTAFTVSLPLLKGKKKK